VWNCIGCEGLEEDVIFTAGFDLSTGGDTVGIGDENDL